GGGAGGAAGAGGGAGAGRVQRAILPRAAPRPRHEGTVAPTTCATDGLAQARDAVSARRACRNRRAAAASSGRRRRRRRRRTPSRDRKSTRLNSSHVKISYAVICL